VTNYWPYRRRVDVRTGLRVKVHPLVEPIDLATARAHLRLDTSGSPPTHPDDDLIQNIYLPAAREACEQYLGSALAPQTLEYSLDQFPGWDGNCYPRDIDLPFGPLIAVDSVTYILSGTATQFSSFNTDLFADRIRLTEFASWPTTDDEPNAVVVRYESGYSTPDSSPNPNPLPAAIRAAILLTLSSIYDNCQEGTICDIHDMPVACKYLLDPYRRRLGFL
jgi:uncharacterized phiE125 gp8 family phage protein